MYSDEWIKKQNIECGKAVRLNTISNYYTWKDELGALVGITINFEEADDTHYELLADDWYLFQEQILNVKRNNNFDAALGELTSKGWLKFSEKLQELGVRYEVISFWDGDDDFDFAEDVPEPAPDEKKMDEEEIRRRLAGRAMEYLMFADDDDCPTEEIQTDKNIILFPDFEKLTEEVKRMRTEISMLLLERDELQFVISKNLNTEYMLKLGAIEYKAYEAQCAALRLKRKLELIQALKNRQEKVVLSSIEQKLDEEFAEYQKILNEQIDKMNEAIERSKCETLSDEDTKEIKKIYREVVKNLHPDLNPNATSEQVKLFENAVTAYKNGDLHTLRIIHEMVSELTIPEDIQLDTMTQLREKHAGLTAMIAAIKENIEKIKSQYPFTIQEILDDPEKLAAKKSEYETIAEQYKEMIDFYKARIEELLR